MEDITVAEPNLDLSLRLDHDDLDVKAFAGKLGLVPDVGWTRGEDRRTPTGQSLGGIREESYCSCPLGVPASDDLGEALEVVVARLERTGSLLQDFVQDGGTARLAVGLFLHEYYGTLIEESVIRRLGQLRISLDFYIYPGD